jgi:hypothetical protein
MSGKEERALAPISAKTSDEVRFAGFRRGNDVDLEAERLELRGERLRHLPFMSWRVAGVDPNQLAQELRGGITALRNTCLTRAQNE